MIGPGPTNVLAETLAALKRQNPMYYAQLAKALQECIDPEHRTLVTAPGDVILHQQGRVAFGIDLLEIVMKCEQITEARQRAVTPQPQKVGEWHG